MRYMKESTQMTQRAKSGLALALACVFSMMSLGVRAQIPENGTPGAPEYKPGVISVNDHTFLTKAAQGNIAEIRLGRLAEEHGSSESVRNLGKRLVKDH